TGGGQHALRRCMARGADRFIPQMDCGRKETLAGDSFACHAAVTELLMVRLNGHAVLYMRRLAALSTAFGHVGLGLPRTRFLQMPAAGFNMVHAQPALSTR